MAKKYVDIEKMIAKAANENLPAFNDAAWQRMNALLEKEEHRRRMAWWWKIGLGILFIPLITISTYLLLNQKPGTGVGENETGSSTVQNSPAGVNGNGSPKSPLNQSETAVSQSLVNKNSPVNAGASIGLSITTDNINSTSSMPKGGQDVLAVAGHRPSNTGNNFQNVSGEPEAGPVVYRRTNESGKKKIESAFENTSPAIPVSGGFAFEPANLGLQPNAFRPYMIATTFKNPELVKPGSRLIESNKITSISKPSSTKLSRLYFSALVGFGADGVRYSYDGSKLRSKLGLGIGYNLNDKWSLGLGMRIHDKLYTAGPKDYKVSSGYWSTVDITYINANCKVYEIPLYASYVFRQKNNTALFASAGLVSFIMKSEKYDFHYTRNSQPQEGYSNFTGNSHLFSSLLLSAGASKKINKKLQLTAAPAIAIPISGVGKGKVKLNSAEFTLGLQYHPWKK